MTAERIEQGRLQRRHNSSAAIHCFEEAIRQAETTGDRQTLVIGLTELALELTETGQTQYRERTKSLLMRAEALLGSVPDSLHINAYLLYCRGIFYFQQRSFVDSLVHLRSAYRNYGKDLEGLCLVDDGLGRYYAALGDFQAALFHFERSLTRRQDLKSDYPRGVSANYLGRLYLQMYIHDKAELYFQQSLEVALKWQDSYLQAQALIGIGQVALTRQQWSEARESLQTALQLLHEPADSARVAYLYLDLVEALLGESRYVEAQNYVVHEVMSRFETVQSPAGMASAQRVLGRVLTYRLKAGVDEFNSDNIEAVEDCFLDASIFFEQQGMIQDYAKTLYDMAYLYKVCTTSRYKYQYRGRAVRSLELALSVLERVNYGATNLIFQIEILLNQIDQSAWLERAVNRLRGRKLLTEIGAISGQREEVTLLCVRLCNYLAFADTQEPSEVMMLFNTYLRAVIDVLQKYQGIVCHQAGSHFLAVFRTTQEQPQLAKDPLAISPELRTPMVDRRSRTHPALRAALAAQEISAELQAFNKELKQRQLPAQSLQIGLNTGMAVLGNIGTYTRAEFTAIGTAVDLAYHFCSVAKLGQIRIGAPTYTYLKQMVSHRSIVVTEIPETFVNFGEVLTYSLDELTYYGEAANKPAWLVNLEFPAVIRVQLPLQSDLEHVSTAAVAAAVSRLGFGAQQRYTIVNAFAEVYREVLLFAPNQAELTLLFLPEETRLEVCANLEGVAEEELDNLKGAFHRMRSDRNARPLTQVSECHLETSPDSLTLRIVQNY